MKGEILEQRLKCAGNFKRFFFLQIFFFVAIYSTEIKILNPRDYLRNADGTIENIFFSPDDDGLISKLLIALIDREQRSIKLTVWVFTDLEIAKALERAQARGIKIEIIVDPTFWSLTSPLSFLHKRGVQIWMYRPAGTDENYHEENIGLKMKMSSRVPIQHNKFWIFERNFDSRPVLCTGSYNLTKKAKEKNEENMEFRSSPLAYKKFSVQFETIKKRSKLLPLNVKNDCCDKQNIDSELIEEVSDIGF
ncbi:MAG: Phospholipase D/Transphosphatidylase [candidate division TM6 bacterium GW2011_GWF2_32_72]|nr:MAG: Phospholipase D/Transphosphatidylase [candidate division TM6 bacterium GW2011_GWF2_32_72]